MIVGTYSSAQCFSDENGKRLEPVISTFATKGSGKYKNEILWLNWGASSPTSIKGSSKVLSTSDYSNAEIKITNDKYFCVKTKIIKVSQVTSDVIDKAWSIMDETYTNEGNTLYHILRSSNQGDYSEIELESHAFVLSRKSANDPFVNEPVRIKGLIIADAESANTNEYLTLTSKGKWDIIEFVNLITDNIKYNYKIKKVTNIDNTSTITMGYGQDKAQAAIAMLNFDADAYSSLSDSYKVNYKSTFKGTGRTSISIGLLTPYADFGDAPESYGAPIHFIDNVQLRKDNLGDKVAETNIGTSKSFVAGGLEKPNTNYVGTLGPDANPMPVYSKDALGDDYTYNYDGTRNVLTNEEDSWPKKFQSFSYKTVDSNKYPIGALISAEIPVKVNRSSVIAGWIDFNLNGKFDDSERVFKKVDVNDSKVLLEWKIPQNRKPFSTYARIRLFDLVEVSKSNQTIDESLLSPSSDVVGGEVEDHHMKILPSAVSNPMILNSTPIYKSFD